MTGGSSRAPAGNVDSNRTEPDVYTLAQRNQYTPPPCPACGGRMNQDFDEVTTPDDGGARKFVRGMAGCSNPSCLGGS